VEDNNDTREVLSILLSGYFDEVYTAQNGLEGIDKYKKHLPNIVLSDINMPEMDGITMAKNIKKINENQKIVLITAYDGKESKEEALEAGVNYFINKPVDFEYLIEILKKI